jgi:hypothetical protein
MRYFDIILVFGYFRSATAFLSVVRHFGEELRVGILPIDAEPSLKSKTGKAHLQYIQLCRQFGAHVVELGEAVQAKLMIVQQFPYPNVLVERITNSVSALKCVGMMTLAMAGMEQHDRFLSQFNIRKVYVPNKRFVNFLLQQRHAEARYSSTELVEVGLPFGRYPVFPEFKTDWLIAAPTLFSFHSESGKQDFLRNVIKLLGQLPCCDVVAYKPHNGNAIDYFTPRIFYLIAKLLSPLPQIEQLLTKFGASLPASLEKHVEKIHTSYLHQVVLRRAVPMAKLTPYAEMSLEAFLPGVKRGVVGGLSNTIWGSLYFKLPFYNCVDANHRSGDSKLLKKSSEFLLDLNLKYFGVPFCNGDIDKGSTSDGVISEDEREGDLVASLREELSHLHA